MDTQDYKYFVGVKFAGSDKSYYFSTDLGDLRIGDLVVVETVSGFEVATVCTPLMNQNLYHSSLVLKPILRRPTEADMRDYETNQTESGRAIKITENEIKKLGLAMDLIDATYSLDGTRITITYTSTEKRVDFRELLKNLAPLLHCRIELRQIASRDKAKMIGGLGICGLPLCCSTFLNQFEGISISRAKNQMLTLNIPKLSGPCGKLICCLLFEDDAYTEAKKEFPRFGTVVHLEEGDYFVDSMNVISRTVRLANKARDDFKTYSLEDVNAMLKGTYKKPVEEKKKEYELPSFNIPNINQGRDASYPGITPSEGDKREFYSAATPDDNNEKGNRRGGRNRHRGRGGRGNNDNRQSNQNNNQNNNQNRNQNRNQQNQNRNQNNQNRQPNKDQSQQGGQNNQNRNRNRHRHHGHGDNQNKGGQGKE